MLWDRVVGGHTEMKARSFTLKFHSTTEVELTPLKDIGPRHGAKRPVLERYISES